MAELPLMSIQFTSCSASETGGSSSSEVGLWQYEDAGFSVALLCIWNPAPQWWFLFRQAFAQCVLELQILISIPI